MKIFLTGFPGCGKTHFGKPAALLLKYPFIDTDSLIEKEEGATVLTIFQVKGEDFFRKKETGILKSLTKKAACFNCYRWRTALFQR